MYDIPYNILDIIFYVLYAIKYYIIYYVLLLKYFAPTPWHRLGEICAEIGPRISAQSLFDKNCQKDLAWWFLLMCSSVFNLFNYLCLQLMWFWVMSSFLRFPLEGTVRHYSTHHPRWRIVSSRFCSPIGPHQPGTLSNILCIISYII